MCPRRLFKWEGGFEPHMGIISSRKPQSPGKIILIIIAPKTLAPASSPLFNVQAQCGGPNSPLHPSVLWPGMHPVGH